MSIVFEHCQVYRRLHAALVLVNGLVLHICWVVEYTNGLQLLRRHEDECRRLVALRAELHPLMNSVNNVTSITNLECEGSMPAAARTKFESAALHLRGSNASEQRSKVRFH